MPKTEAQMRSIRKWDSEHMRTATCKLSNEEHAAFKAYAEAHGKTVSGALLEYVRKCITESAPITPGPQPRRRRGFTLDGQSFRTMEELQAYLTSQGISVTDNVILNWISKGRLSRENQEKYPLLSQIKTYDYTD